MSDLKIARIAVLGAGTMGQGIAHVSAAAGFTTTIRDIRQDLIERAMGSIQSNLSRAVAKGKLSMEDREHVLSKLRSTVDLKDAVSTADLIIEAVPENLRLKQDLLREVTSLVKSSAIVATNTSSLSITAIASEVAGSQRVVGMHFFNPPTIMRLLEVVRGTATSDETVQTVLGVAQRMGKETIVVKDSPGFATSRLGVCLGLEAIRMLEDGVASAADIDRAMELGYNHPIGPLRLTDLVGLDVRLAISEHLQKVLESDRFMPPNLLRRMVSEGKLGRKVGQGFFEWPPEKA